MSHNTNSKFTLVPKHSIGLYAESVGNPNLKDEVLTNLSEDLTYRLRETLNVRLIKQKLLILTRYQNLPAASWQKF